MFKNQKFEMYSLGGSEIEELDAKCSNTVKFELNGKTCVKIRQELIEGYEVF